MRIYSALLVMLLVALTACSGGPPASSELSPQTVLEAFEGAGLEVAEARPMTREDYGPLPLGKDGIRFFIPSLGEENGGRIMLFDTKEKADQAKAFYDSLGENSALLFTHAFQRGNLVVQINGTLPDEQAAEYERILSELP